MTPQIKQRVETARSLEKTSLKANVKKKKGAFFFLSIKKAWHF